MVSVSQMNKVGNRVFLNPIHLLTYDLLAKCSLGPNTYRGFHRIDKNLPGAASVFRRVLKENRTFILKEIKTAKSEKDIDGILRHLCGDLFHGLKTNIRPEQLNSFNKLRKPMDIVIQHMVAMGEDFSDARPIVTDWLFLPLDSQIFQSDFVFTDHEAKSLCIKRSFTFKDIEDQGHYADIQDFLKDKANQIGLKHRIYFDLVWNDRYQSNGTNLFRTNPN